jgi:hypothetical protein
MTLQCKKTKEKSNIDEMDIVQKAWFINMKCCCSLLPK